ncbi:MAG: 1,2-phenylacetyl-CoA epoxidase subunit A, partial [Bacteroidetes bacterium]
YPTLMRFGPPDSESPHSADAIKWRIKRETNDQLRQKFVNQTVPQAEFIGLKIPDPNFKWNEEKKGYGFPPPDWEEFKRVISGNGPCNKERLAARIKAHEEGKWVREAAQAYAQKHKKELLVS